MRGTAWSHWAVENRLGLVVDTVSALISLSAATAIRFGTLFVAQYLAPLWPAIVLLVGLRVMSLRGVGVQSAPRSVFTRRQAVAVVSGVAASSIIAALLVLGLTAPFGHLRWFPFGILFLELPLGMLCATGARLTWAIWEESVVPRCGHQLEALSSRTGTILSGLFVGLAAAVLWQAVGLLAEVAPVTWESVLAAARLLVLSAVLFLLPGYAVLVAARPRMGLGPLEVAVISAGLSVAVVPLLLYFCGLAGVELNSLSVGTIFAALGALALWRSAPEIREVLHRATFWSAAGRWRVCRPRVLSLSRSELTATQALCSTVALVFLMALVVRVYAVKDLSLGMWGDSYHHTMIAQLLVDNGGLFSSWEPYAPLSSLTYHFGFHSLAAFYHWLTGVPVGRSVVDVGQLLNALAVPLMYVLTARLTGNRWAGLSAALVVGFLSRMPMYYVNWGRYPQLAGQSILPVAMLLTLKAASAKHGHCRVILVGAVAISGLTLTHYPVMFMYLCFVPLALVAPAWTAWRRRDARLAARPCVNVAAMGALAALMTAPWTWKLARALLPQHVAATMESGVSPSRIASLGQLVASGDIFFFLQAYLFLLSILGIVAGIKQGRAGPKLVACWAAAVACLFVLVPLPGGGASQYRFALVIALYLPAAVLSGYLVGRLLGAASTSVRHGGLLAALCLVLAMLATTGNAAGILNPDNSYVRNADEKAMAWIKRNTGDDARFLVNSAFYGGMVVGTDAGWWIPLLTGRDNTVPPMPYGLESSPEPDYKQKVADFNRAIQDAALDDPDTLRLLRENGVTHVYVGETSGNLRPELLTRSPCYETVYHEDTVWVFRVSYDCLGVGQHSVHKSAALRERAALGP